MTWSDFSLSRYRRFLRPGAIGVVLVWLAMWWCEVSVRELMTGISKGVDLLGYFLPPDWSTVPMMLEPAVTTVVVALVATPIGAVLSVIFGLAAARNVAPPWLRTTTRTLIAIERGIPEIVLLLVLVAAFGMGSFSGVVALAIGSIGMLGKLVGDAIEEMDPRPIESVASVGATKAQVIRYAVLPQVFPSLLANSLFRFEVNIRASVLLGAIGAGGIGYELTTAMTQLEYRKATVAALMSLAVVFAAERCSDFLRSRVLNEGRLQ